MVISEMKISGWGAPPPTVRNASPPFTFASYDADLKGDDACGTTYGGGPPPEILISEMTIQGSVYVQNLLEDETIKSDFEFAHIRHTYGTFFEILAKFPRICPNFQRFCVSLLRGARARQYSQNDRQPHLFPNI